jgi:uncharacterized membrane protein YkoI
MKVQYAALGLAFLLALPVIANRVGYHSSAQIPNIERTDAAEDVAMQKVAKISLEQAQQIAQKVAPKAKLLSSELDNEDGNVVYEVEFDEGGLERTVVVDAGNGKVLENSLDND